MVTKIKSIFIISLFFIIMLSSCSPVANSPTQNKANPAARQAKIPGNARAAKHDSIQYYSPLANAQFVSKSASIIVRYGPSLSKAELTNIDIEVHGSQSGTHSGTSILADDQQTIVYKPGKEFLPGEQVHITINSKNLSQLRAYPSLDYTFSIAPNQQVGSVASIAVPSSKPKSAFPTDLTLPKDIPHYTVSMSSPLTANEGDFFIAPFYWGGSTVGSYLLILDNNGQIVYYKSVGDQLSGFDFKLLPGGYLTYYDQKDAVNVILDSHYQVVGKYPAENGYTADLHDFLMMPNGYVFLMAYDTETIDMSKIVAGGNTSAAVTGLIIQELDPDQNVIFEWRSWDHFAYTDTNISLTDSKIDLVHGNGITLDSDGNLLLSSRNLNEITKINLQTGAIIWMLGGKNSTFVFTNDGGFAYQHDISVLPNGDITLFDNHGTDPAPTASRAVEYKLDLNNNTATKVWEYLHTPPVFTDYMGSIQRLPDGNTIIGWGDPVAAQGYVSSSITEVTLDGQVVFELTFDAPYVSYRAFRDSWIGTPDSTPTLAFQQDGLSTTLGYSWNGSTEVASWMLYDGTSPLNLNPADQKAKDGFETQSYFFYLPTNVCYFQVAALDKNGKELSRSAVVSTNLTQCPLE